MSVEFRLRLLEKAIEARDCGRLVRAQHLVDVANWLKKRIDAIEEQDPQQQDGLHEASTGSASGEYQYWMRLNRAAAEPRPREAARRRAGG